MQNQLRLFSIILLLGNQYASPMKMLAQRFAAAARICTVRPIILCSKAVKDSAIASKTINPILAVPMRCMAMAAQIKTVADMRPKSMTPKAFNRFLGSTLTYEYCGTAFAHVMLLKKPMLYTLDEPLFLHMCVHASKALLLNQKPLHELIKRVTGLKQATFGTVVSHSPMRIKNNYGHIRLTTEEIVSLLQHIPWNGTMEYTPTSPDSFKSKCTVWLNGKKVILHNTPLTKPVTEVRGKTVAVSHVPVEGEKRIDAEVPAGKMMQMLTADTAVLEDFNTLLQQIEKSDASLIEKNVAPKEFNKFLGASLDNVLNEGPVTYGINEYEFIDLCVQASKAQGPDKKPLYELIQRITKGKKAERLIKKFSSKHSYGYGTLEECGFTSKFNYGSGEINLTGAELARCLFNYIPWNGTVEEGPSGNGTIALMAIAWVNGKERELFCAPKTRQMIEVDRPTDGVYHRGVEIKGQKGISLHLGVKDLASPDVLKQFNELVEKAHKSEK